MPYLLSPRDLVSRPGRMDATVPRTHKVSIPTLRGSISELSLRKIVIGTSSNLLLSLRKVEIEDKERIYVSFLFFISSHYYCYLSIYLTIE